MFTYMKWYPKFHQVNLSFWLYFMNVCQNNPSCLLINLLVVLEILIGFLDSYRAHYR